MDLHKHYKIQYINIGGAIYDSSIGEQPKPGAAQPFTLIERFERARFRARLFLLAREIDAVIQCF